jgi:hypothetical protein
VFALQQRQNVLDVRFVLTDIPGGQLIQPVLECGQLRGSHVAELKKLERGEHMELTRLKTTLLLGPHVGSSQKGPLVVRHSVGSVPSEEEKPHVEKSHALPGAHFCAYAKESSGSFITSVPGGATDWSCVSGYGPSNDVGIVPEHVVDGAL